MMASSDLLNSVEAAITAIAEGAQEYQLADGRRVRRANLADLMRLRDELRSEVAAESNSGFYTRAALRGPA